MFRFLHAPLGGAALAAALAAGLPSEQARAGGVHIGGRLLHVDIGDPHRHEVAYAPVVAPPHRGCYAGGGYGRRPHHAGYRSGYDAVRVQYNQPPYVPWHRRPTAAYGPYPGPGGGWGLSDPRYGGHHGPRW